jgi:hypothetical protein
MPQQPDLDTATVPELINRLGQLSSGMVVVFQCEEAGQIGGRNHATTIFWRGCDLIKALGLANYASGQIAMAAATNKC